MIVRYHRGHWISPLGPKVAMNWFPLKLPVVPKEDMEDTPGVARHQRRGRKNKGKSHAFPCKGAEAWPRTTENVTHTQSIA